MHAAKCPQNIGLSNPRWQKKTIPAPPLSAPELVDPSVLSIRSLGLRRLKLLSAAPKQSVVIDTVCYGAVDGLRLDCIVRAEYQEAW